MHRPLNRLLLFLAAPLIPVDGAWVMLGHFATDARNYAGVLVAPLALAALYYDHRREEPALSATPAVAAFLIAFPAAASLLSYLVLTVAGPRIDNPLAAADLAPGFRWMAVMALADDHPRVNMLLSFATAWRCVLPSALFRPWRCGHCFPPSASVFPPVTRCRRWCWPGMRERNPGCAGPCRR